MCPDGSIADEYPKLLDPTCASDVELLWYLQDGSVVYKDLDTASEDVQRVRAECSIKICDLNGIKLQEARRDKMRTIRDLIEDGDYWLLQRSQGSPSSIVDGKLATITTKLAEYIKESAEFSVAALHTFLALRDSPTASGILAMLGLPS